MQSRSHNEAGGGYDPPQRSEAWTLFFFGPAIRHTITSCINPKSNFLQVRIRMWGEIGLAFLPAD